jgi:hypothetical protein
MTCVLTFTSGGAEHEDGTSVSGMLLAFICSTWREDDEFSACLRTHTRVRLLTASRLSKLKTQFGVSFASANRGAWQVKEKKYHKFKTLTTALGDFVSYLSCSNVQ